MRVSIILPTRNSLRDKRRSVELCLMSLSRQDLGNHAWELIVVDNESTDDTREFTEHARSWHPMGIRVVSSPIEGARSLARNRGVEASTGDKLLFIDDDTLFPNPRTLMLMAEAIEGDAFLCGVHRLWTYIGWSYEKVRAELADGRYDYVLEISALPRGLNRASGHRSLLDVSFLANCGGLTRSLFDRVGGFNEEYVGWGRDDCDLMYRLIVERNASFCNGRDLGPVVHLNHEVGCHEHELARNEAIYQSLEKKHGLCLRYSHLFEQWEYDDHDILVKRDDAIAP